MGTNNLSGQWWNAQHTIDVKLQVLLFEEDSIHYAYIPALDITGYGNNEQEARDSLQVCLSEFFEYSIDKDTFVAELKRLGWHQEEIRFEAPHISEQIATNEQLRDIVDHKQYRVASFDVALPALS